MCAMAYQCVNPDTGKVLKSFEHLNNTQLDESPAAAEHCFQSWKKMGCAERAVILNQAAALLHTQVDDFAQLETLEATINTDQTVQRRRTYGDTMMVKYYD